MAFKKQLQRPTLVGSANGKSNLIGGWWAMRSVTDWFSDAIVKLVVADRRRLISEDR
jgi:hypothetical protein